MTTDAELRPVVVTTAHRGVFFGYTLDTTGKTITLKRARMCVYWSKILKGVVGLASQGPNSECRISDAADMELRDVTAVLDVTAKAVEAWERAPWS